MSFERRVLTAEEITMAREIASAKNARGVIARVDWSKENPQCPLCYAHLDDNGDCPCGINKIKNEEYEAYIARRKNEKHGRLFSLFSKNRR